MSWNGTVRCGHCGQKGHNKTGCEELRKEWERDPNGYYGKMWARIMARKAAPKNCSYCDETGHTRSGCASMKEHKSAYARDLLLWRLAFEKYFSSIGYGPLALIKFNARPSYVANISGRTQWVYSSDDCYPGPPIGTTPPKITAQDLHLDHLEIMRLPAYRHQQLPSMGYINAFGPAVVKNRSAVTLTLPTIPGIFPRFGTDHTGSLVDRLAARYDDGLDHSSDDWEIVSPSPIKDNKPFGENFTAAHTIKEMTKTHFSRDQGKCAYEFRAFKTEYRNILDTYLDGILEISDMESVTEISAFESI